MMRTTLFISLVGAILVGCGPKDDGQPKAPDGVAATMPVSPAAQAQADFMKKTHGGANHQGSTGG